MSKLLNDTSKFLSFVLRHEPQAIGITLDSEGWADISALIDGANKSGGLKADSHLLRLNTEIIAVPELSHKVHFEMWMSQISLTAQLPLSGLLVSETEL